jgi:hypothetical protein
LLGDVIIPDFKLYYRVIVTEIAWYWHKTRHIDQRNRTEYPQIKPCSHSHLISDKGAQKIHGEKTASSTGYSHVKV